MSLQSRLAKLERALPDVPSPSPLSVKGFLAKLELDRVLVLEELLQRTIMDPNEQDTYGAAWEKLARSIAAGGEVEVLFDEFVQRMKIE